MNKDEIEKLESLPPSLALLSPSSKPLTARGLRWLRTEGFRVQALEGSSTGVITKEGIKGFVFVKLNPHARKLAEVWLLKSEARV